MSELARLVCVLKVGRAIYNLLLKISDHYLQCASCENVCIRITETGLRHLSIHGRAGQVGDDKASEKHDKSEDDNQGGGFIALGFYSAAEDSRLYTGNDRCRGACLARKRQISADGDSRLYRRPT